MECELFGDQCRLEGHTELEGLVPSREQTPFVLITGVVYSQAKALAWVGVIFL